MATRPLLLAFLLVVLPGCETEPPPPPAKPPPQKAAPVEAKKVLIGPNVWLELAGKQRRVLISAEVCLREGALELFLTRKGKKEHEAILAADVDARDVHKALLAAGAEAGSPVRFQPKYQAAHGSPIKVSIIYEEKGKLVTVPAQHWVRNARSAKNLEIDWVFAGSRFIPNPLDPKAPDYYLANDGDIICVSNFETALLDLPINSSKDNADLVFEAETEVIPPREHKVVVAFEVLPAKSK